MNGERELRWGKGGDEGLSSPQGQLGSIPEVYAQVKGVRSSTSKSGPRDIKDPGTSCAAVSGQREGQAGAGGRLGL